MKKDSILWKIEKKGNRPSFLFGTVHVNHVSMESLVHKLAFYINQCDLYAGEMDFSEIQALGNNASFPSLPIGESLKDRLTKGQWKSLNFWVQKKIGIPADHLQYQYPIQIIGMLTADNFDAGPSLDFQLFELAKSLEKECTGLESWADQENVVLDMPLEAQVAYLVKVVKGLGNGKAQAKKLMQHYLKGDATRLYKSTRNSAGRLRKILIFDRNKYMAERFLTLSSEKPIFASVGAAHLQGGKGMLRYLKIFGFSVKSIAMADLHLSEV